MNEVAIILFHSNHNRYPQSWIDDCLGSIWHQTYQGFKVLEIDYGKNPTQLYPGSLFYQQEFPTHAHAHNFLCEKAVSYGNVFNTNIDDIYTYDRIERQLEYALKYDVVSGNHSNINEKNQVTRADIQFSSMDIEKEAAKGHNIISHPTVVYSANFIQNSGLLNPDLIPKDDSDLWKRSFGRFSFFIVPFTVCYYRIHEKKVSRKW